MAGKGDAVIDVSLNGTLEPASPSLQNCIKYSSTGKYFSVLCDFGVALILEIKGTSRVYVSLKLEMKINVVSQCSLCVFGKEQVKD